MNDQLEEALSFMFDGKIPKLTQQDFDNAKEQRRIEREQYWKEELNKEKPVIDQDV